MRQRTGGKQNIRRGHGGSASTMQDVVTNTEDEVMKNQEAQAPTTIKVTECKLTKGEKRLDGNLVTYPVSYRYNGGIIVDGKHYSGFDVVAPTVPEGYKLVNIGVGLQLNAQPPYATRLLKKVQA